MADHIITKLHRAAPGEDVLFIEHGWNDRDGSREDGQPGIGLFASALQVWACAQDISVTVDEAAEVFNVDPALIREAVDYHGFMFLAGDEICQDGE